MASRWLGKGGGGNRDADTATFAELAQVAENRSKTYDFLKAFYIQPPSREFLKSLMGEDFLPLLGSVKKLEGLPADAAEGVESIKLFIGRLKDAGFKLHESLAVEYTRLFRGIKPSYGPPPPYESVYREGTVWGESAAQVLRTYRQFGLGLQDEFRGEPPDHIGFELDFMRLLCGREAEAWKNRNRKEVLRCLRLEEGFLNEHLTAWVYDFCDKVVEQDALGFYRGIAKITKSFIRFDHSQINAYLDVAERSG
ncbi:molecular chaperone TorD family protein [Candidatus Hecatella orcuttiae]|jgi:TorA maturation chaperone TorD|uniref:TorD/DmsD family molecular chaperone n=1 Tax=Candidatus Hecatella orcuttiae TaxID=1935119 RepID=UPI00286809C8|nr:molecular chaperone TorD family protein [Candidatus Hecatella orcuttiae]